LLNCLDLEHFVNEEWVTLPSDVHEYRHGVIHQVDIISANMCSLKHFQWRILLIVQIPIADGDNLWTEKWKELLWTHLHCLESSEH
jgi:hypothetical protein